LQQVFGVRPIPGERNRRVQQMISARGQQPVKFLIQTDSVGPACVGYHRTTSLAAHQGRVRHLQRCLRQQESLRGG
jgi:hypothetical protein